MLWLSWIISNVALASVVALAAWFVQRRIGHYAIARILWVIALVKLVTPPIVSVSLIEFPQAMACALGTCGCSQHTNSLTNVSNMLPWVVLAAWIAGSGIVCSTVWRRWARFRRLIACAGPAPPEWQSLAARFAGELSLRRTPEVLAVPGRLPPIVVPGWRYPRVLVPIALLERLNRKQRKALLLHELVHVKRGDHLVRLLEVAVCIVFWWLPIRRSIGRQLRACEEACCDAAVVARLPQGRCDYARLLLDVVDFTNPLPRSVAPHATAMGVADHLEDRLLSILSGAQKTRWAWPSMLLAIGVVFLILPCELRCGFARRVAAEPHSAASRWDGCEPAATPAATFGCPS